MLPSIQFNFLICTYLPGLPLAIAIYAAFIRSALLEGAKNDYWVSYIVIAPLIIGLFIDAIRHGVAIILSSVIPIFWEFIEPEKLKKFKSKYGETGSAFLLDKLAILYHVFEFFFNLAISMLLCLLVLVIWKENLATKWLVLILVISGVSVLFAWFFKKMQQMLIEKYAN